MSIGRDTSDLHQHIRKELSALVLRLIVIEMRMSGQPGSAAQE
jgi:hypothetical protein